MQNIPEGYQQVMPYLIVSGALRFQAFMQTVFDATEKMKAMQGENLVMHGELQIGKSTIMFSDSSEQWPPITAGMYVYVENVDEAYRKALKAGASSIVEPENKEYGRSCGVKDPFGNTWWIVTLL